MTISYFFFKDWWQYSSTHLPSFSTTCLLPSVSPASRPLTVQLINDGCCTIHMQQHLHTHVDSVVINKHMNATKTHLADKKLLKLQEIRSCVNNHICWILPLRCAWHTPRTSHRSLRPWHTLSSLVRDGCLSCCLASPLMFLLPAVVVGSSHWLRWRHYTNIFGCNR